MKQADIHVGGVYAYRVGYGRSGRCVRAIVTETPVEKRNSRHTLISKGSRIELPDEPGNRHGKVVPNRDLVSTWAEYDRDKRAGEITSRWRRTVREANAGADTRLATIWNDLMGVLAIEADEHRFDPEPGYRRSLKFDPVEAIGMAQRLTLHAGAAAFMAEHQTEIERIVDHRDETLALAEKQRDEALAALDAEQEAA